MHQKIISVVIYDWEFFGGVLFCCHFAVLVEWHLCICSESILMGMLAEASSGKSPNFWPHFSLMEWSLDEPPAWNGANDPAADTRTSSRDWSKCMNCSQQVVWMITNWSFVAIRILTLYWLLLTLFWVFLLYIFWLSADFLLILYWFSNDFYWILLPFYWPLLNLKLILLRVWNYYQLHFVNHPVRLQWDGAKMSPTLHHHQSWKAILWTQLEKNDTNTSIFTGFSLQQRC